MEKLQDIELKKMLTELADMLQTVYHKLYSQTMRLFLQFVLFPCVP